MALEIEITSSFFTNVPSCSRNPSTMVTNGKESSPVNIPYLPDDVLFNCLARVSNLYYPTLSLVSKRFRSLLASPELYETRSLIGSTESCLYVCLSYRSKPRWFTLSKKPTQFANPNPYSTWSTPSFNPFRILTNRTRTSSSGNLLVSVPDHHFDDLCQWINIRVGSDTYIVIGGSTNPEPSSRVYVMDRRSQSDTWHEAPSMLVAKKDPLVGVLDGKIYVVERSRDCDFSNFIEVFDPKTQIWEHVPSPSSEIRGTHITSSVSFEGKLYLSFKDFKSIVYNPEENRWDVVRTELESLLFKIYFSCVIDKVVYFCPPGRWSRKLKWYDFERRSWRHVKGLKKLAIQGCVRLENYGGKLVVLWEENVRSIGSTKEKKIWCAEIALERDNGQEIFGKVMWCDVVLVVPASCQIEELLVDTI